MKLFDDTLLLDDPNEAVITELFIFLSTDATGEGICAAEFTGIMTPLVTSRARVAEKLKPIAEHVAKISGKPVKLVRFSVREDVWP